MHTSSVFEILCHAGGTDPDLSRPSGRGGSTRTRCSGKTKLWLSFATSASTIIIGSHGRGWLGPLHRAIRTLSSRLL